ncbi:hypothetical protein H744_1c0794 [Photobacterium gaetbulicola Gung47]|uniref:Uncharacterized protein n=1 Tax=Photobacterium gaetbulicola Gung47 TaxID=658445 RepID=A0A0C5WL73_9GAMM|nr:hypothetical protein H744_1c0794 [Photobacterium gaetbulicola Gung47]
MPFAGLRVSVCYRENYLKKPQAMLGALGCMTYDETN